MKKLWIKIAIVSALVVAGGGLWWWRATRMPSLYGTFTGAPKVEVAELIVKPKAFIGKTVAIRGVITEQCESMGCFFYFRDGKRSLRVDLADIAMWAPRNKNGSEARVEGQLVPFNDGYQLWASAVEFE